MSQKELTENFSDDKMRLLRLIRTGRKDPVFFSEEVLGVELHDGQKLWLWMTTNTRPDAAFDIGLKLNDEFRSLWGSRKKFEAILAKNSSFRKNILVPSNRWGKTLVTAVKHIWYLYYKIGVQGTPNSIARKRCGTLNLSPHSLQAEAGYNYILDILNSKLVYMKDGRSKTNRCLIPEFYLSHNSQKRMIFFSNETNYRAIPTGEDKASSLAGTPYIYISYDECAQSLHLRDELPAKIMSRLIDFGGPLDLVSTPEVDKPSHQYFYRIAKLGMKAEEGWWTLVGKISDNIFLSEKEVKKTTDAIKSTDPIKYRQVAFGEFVTTGKKMFDTIVIERMWDSDRPEPVMDGHNYLMVADWGFADTGDPTVFMLIDYTLAPRYRLCFCESIRGGSPFAVLARAKILQREWNGAKFLHDASSMGGGMIKKMLREMQMGEIIDFTSCGGQKMDMLFCLLTVLSEGRKTKIDAEGKVEDLNPNFGRMRSYMIPELEEQMGNYQYNPEKGISDKRLDQDFVMCLGMGCWWLERKLMKRTVKDINYNPFAPTADKVVTMEEMKRVGMKVVNIPEKRIM